MNNILIYMIAMWIFYPGQAVAGSGDKGSHIAATTSGPVEVTAVFQVLAALIFIIILIIALAWAYKRYGYAAGGNASLMKVVGAISLGGKEKAVLLQVGEEQVLLGVSPGYVRKIHDITEPVKVHEESDTGSFVSKLNLELQKVLGK